MAQELSIQSGAGQGYSEINRVRATPGEISKGSQFEELKAVEPVLDPSVLSSEPEPETAPKPVEPPVAKAVPEPDPSPEPARQAEPEAAPEQTVLVPKPRIKPGGLGKPAAVSQPRQDAASRPETDIISGPIDDIPVVAVDAAEEEPVVEETVRKRKPPMHDDMNRR
jgi:hypothetical protein